MAELVDVQDLGSCGAIRVGSTPTTRTTHYGIILPCLVSAPVRVERAQKP